MGKDEILLRLEMGRLEIEPAKPKHISNKENPFVPHYSSRSLLKKYISQKCHCSVQRKQSSVGISKKKSNRILKEPVLKILKCEHSSINSESDCKDISNNHFQVISSKSLCSDTLSLCALVQNCNQLKISSGSKDSGLKTTGANNGVNWWRNDISKTRCDKESNQRTQTSTCSQQALNPPCDVTIDELASYFETLVHIPKKMSSMAEMMYI